MSKNGPSSTNDGHVTYNSDGSVSRTYKNVTNDGYTTYNDNGQVSRTYKNVLDDGYTTYHDDGGVSRTYKNVTNDGYTTYHDDSGVLKTNTGKSVNYTANVLPGGNPGGRNLSIVYGILEAALMICMLIAVPLVFHKNVRMVYALVSIVILVFTWKLILTPKNCEVVNAVMTLLIDVAFGALCHFAFYDNRADGIIIWFCTCVVAIILWAYTPANKKVPYNSLEGSTLFHHIARPIIAWLSPFIVLVAGEIFIYNRHSYEPFYIVLFALIVIPSVISLLKVIAETVKENK